MLLQQTSIRPIDVNRAKGVRFARPGLNIVVAASVLGAGLWPVASIAEPAPSLAQLDSAFVCPEAMRSNQERSAALRAFTDAYAAAEPQATPADMVRYRRLLLQKHGCRKTLERLDAAAAAERNGDVRRQAWLPLTDTGTAKLFLSMDHLSSIIDPRFPDEHSVEAYSRLAFSQNRTTSATHVTYDELISREIYFCNIHKYSLIENIYFKGGVEVLRDAGEPVGPSAPGGQLYAVTNTPAGSLNAMVEKAACETEKGRAT